ncbi:MAG: ribbon-helix-helix domain-containing protein [Candidatus Korarchaeota archaeon]|nr:ribbon-helix-helix domain-containing protein [Thermoproteota archaeon]
MSVERVQVNIWMPRGFVRLIDETAKLTGSTRSDLIRRAVERYLQELKESSLIREIQTVQSQIERIGAEP